MMSQTQSCLLLMYLSAGLWDYRRMQSTGDVIAISQLKSEEQSNTESCCFRLKPEVNDVSDEKINNFSDGSLKRMNYFEK